jgi:hypothetical protein
LPKAKLEELMGPIADLARALRVSER